MNKITEFSEPFIELIRLLETKHGMTVIVSDDNTSVNCYGAGTYDETLDELAESIARTTKDKNVTFFKVPKSKDYYDQIGVNFSKISFEDEYLYIENVQYLDESFHNHYNIRYYKFDKEIEPTIYKTTP